MDSTLLVLKPVKFRFLIPFEVSVKEFNVAHLAIIKKIEDRELRQVVACTLSQANQLSSGMRMARDAAAGLVIFRDSNGCNSKILIMERSAIRDVDFIDENTQEIRNSMR
jgi:hypothetical protein